MSQTLKVFKSKFPILEGYNKYFILIKIIIVLTVFMEMGFNISDW